MKITIVNKFADTGGAAIAAKRLYEALKENNIDVSFLVQQDCNQYLSTSNNKLKKAVNFARFSAERLKIYLNIKDKKDLFAFDTASFGEDITKHPSIKNADIIHLHWINFGFLSIKSIQKLLYLNKPIVWTFHDMWAFTGGCFYSRNCSNFSDNCTSCHFLKKKSKIAYKTFLKKKKTFNNNNLHIIALSNWIYKLVKQSSLLKQTDIYSIPNPINTNIFKPYDKYQCRKTLQLNKNKLLLGFVAYNVKDERKGAIYLKNSILKLFKDYPELKNKIQLIAIGKINDKNFFENIPIKFTGYINETEQLIKYYNALDLMILPSLEDNVPLVIQEAMACQIPFVAFDTGGIPDLIDHKINGYLAKSKNTYELAKGIKFIIDNNHNNSMGIAARQKMIQNFSYPIIAKKMTDFYNKILEK
jgi:glycosyltransferase involved in cell wall biosynthesis